ncbi:hypothetical protein V1514DRAFT_328586 [Lipomyces japonicus]|uniref:uncharacterized protein n=1 Tax=Lipomyces japonicus TaxID=56871 RepID=UPI0034CF1FE9
MVDSQIKIPSRVSIDGHLGTIRYHGLIPAWDKPAFGVEWDDACRGKHSGIYDGKQYFKCHVESSATFIKSSRKSDLQVSFLQALNSKYAPKYEHEIEKKNVVFGTKVVERVGFDKFRRLLTQLDKLTFVSLQNERVKYASDNLAEVCPRLQDLDLSQNLFESVNEVAKIVAQLPKLTSLTLNGNRFLDWELDDELKDSFANITMISLSATLIPHQVLLQLGKLFPNAKVCNLAANLLSESNLAFKTAWHVESLDLSFNNFSTIPHIRQCPSLDRLNLSHNSIPVVSGLLEWTAAGRITSIDLRYNLISAWSSVDMLVSAFTTTKEARLRWNPLFAEMNEDEAHVLTIARWGSLQSLNGTKISDRERTNAEIYFMNKVVLDNGSKLDFDPTCQRWIELCEKYGTPEAPVPVPKRSKFINVGFVVNDVKKNRNLPRGLTVEKLKNLVGKWYKVAVSDITLDLIDDGQRRRLADNIREIEFYGVDDGLTIDVGID